jgi:hypothetical protein
MFVFENIVSAGILALFSETLLIIGERRGLIQLSVEDRLFHEIGVT